MLAARAWPGCGRSGSCSSGRKTASVPSSASTVIAAVTSATSHSSSRSTIAMQSIPSMPSVPLMRASPSLASSTTGAMPAAASRSADGASTPSGPNAVPSPISTSAQCDKGARSPLQPSEPYSSTFGVMPALSIAAMVSTTTGRTPVRPDARVLSRRNTSARTTSRSTGAPMPAACERISERCSCVRSSGEMCRVASAPNPVEMPYFGSADAASTSMRSRVAATPASAFGVSSTRALPRATAITSSTCTPWSSRWTTSSLMRFSRVGRAVDQDVWTTAPRRTTVRTSGTPGR